MEKTGVVNLKVEEYDVYIGRPSKWGNPFVIGRCGDREEVIQKYKEYVMSKPELMESLCELEGKKLGLLTTVRLTCIARWNVWLCF